MAENEYVIETAISTKGLEKGIEKAEKELDRLGKKYESIKAKQQKFLELGGQKQELSKEYKAASAEVEKYGNKLETLLNRQEKIQETGGSTNTQSYKQLEYEIDQVSEKLYKAEKVKEELEDSKYVPTRQWAQIQYDMEATRNSMAETAASKEQMEKRLAEVKSLNPIERVRKAFHKLGDSAEESSKKTTGLFKNIKKSGKSGLLNILKYAFGIRSLFVLFNRLRNALVDGFKNLAQFNNGVNPVNSAISSLKSSLTNLKNSFATAFAPILTVVQPILTAFIDKISQAVSAIGKLFAALTGAKTFTKAVKVQENYAQSLGDTASNTDKATKATKRYLSPLDDLNKMERKDESASGGVGGGINPNQMFQTEEIEGSIQRLAKKFKDFFSNIDFNPLKKSIDILKSSFKGLTDLLSSGLKWALDNVLKPIAKWTIEKALPKLITLFAHALDLVVAVLKDLKPLGQWLFDVFLKPLASTVGGVIDGILDILDGLLVFLKGVFTLDQQTVIDGLIKMFKGFGKVVLSVAKGIQSILNNLDMYLQKVFAVDWTKWLGAIGKPLNAFSYSFKKVWDGIKQIINGFVKFLSGTFAGDWRKAWEGILQTFVGIWNTIGAIAKTPINVVIGALNGLLQAVVAGVNAMFSAINKLSLKVPDWIPTIGGKTLGFNLQSITAPRIPYLATGTVVPPSAKQFMAVLGDNNRETEVVSPLSTMKQAMSEVMAEYGGNGGSYHFSAQINRKTLFDEVITEGKMRQMQNGMNPFELA